MSVTHARAGSAVQQDLRAFRTYTRDQRHERMRVAWQYWKGRAMQVFLETQRLVLRRFSVADADNLVSLDADPDVMRFVPGGHPRPARRSKMNICPHSLAITAV